MFTLFCSWRNNEQCPQQKTRFYFMISIDVYVIFLSYTGCLLFLLPLSISVFNIMTLTLESPEWGRNELKLKPVGFKIRILWNARWKGFIVRACVSQFTLPMPLDNISAYPKLSIKWNVFVNNVGLCYFCEFAKFFSVLLSQVSPHNMSYNRLLKFFSGKPYFSRIFRTVYI